MEGGYEVFRLVRLENQKEWQEGLAKYTELTLWRVAATTTGYKPLPAILSDPGFNNYADYQKRLSQELQQIKSEANVAGDMRFYYTGLVQAILLDRLALDWRTKILSEGKALEDILKQAVQ